MNSTEFIKPQRHRPAQPRHLRPESCYYDRWQNELKKTLDPNDAADAGFYTDPDFAVKISPEHAQRVIERVWGDVIKIEERDRGGAVEKGLSKPVCKRMMKITNLQPTRFSLRSIERDSLLTNCN